MDKHERPYRCERDGCEKLPGFTYSGGLVRHEKEVHSMHGGPKETLRCPHQSCNRHRGKAFSRQENLSGHLRRVHQNATSPPDHKRKRLLSDSAGSDDEGLNLTEEVDRLRQENQELREALRQQKETQTTMMAQIADLQGALQLSRANMEHTYLAAS